MCPGNHEATCSEETPKVCPDGQRNFTSYRERFRMPALESGAVNNMYFSFDYGLVHFISVDTEVGYPGSPEGPGTLLNAGPFGNQLAWLEADLKKATSNRATVPWILVAGHRPFYSSNSAGEGTWPPSQQWFEPLFVKYDVDIVYWGHIHWYERSWPTTTNGTVTQTNYTDATAPMYIVSAAPGNVEGLAPGDITQPYTAFVNGDDFGVGLLHVRNATHLDWRWHRSSDEKLLDSITIVKQQRWHTLQQQKQQQQRQSSESEMDELQVQVQSE